MRFALVFLHHLIRLAIYYFSTHDSNKLCTYCSLPGYVMLHVLMQGPRRYVLRHKGNSEHSTEPQYEPFTFFVGDFCNKLSLNVTLSKP